MEKIDSFNGKYRFLSNFYHAPVSYEGFTFQNNEAAFQSMKDRSRTAQFTSLPPNEAKRLGRKVKLRSDWEEIKDIIMYEICWCKFTQNPALKAKLLKTGNAELVEGNTWGDRYWGVCDGEGENKLGEILMRIREELRSQ